MKNLKELREEKARLQQLSRVQKEVLLNDLDLIRRKFSFEKASASSTVDNILIRSGGLEFILTFLIDKLMLKSRAGLGKQLTAFALKKAIENKWLMGLVKSGLGKLMSRNGKAEAPAKMSITDLK